MSSVKERIVGAVTVMNERDANTLWHIIINNFSDWTRIEEAEPDEADRAMLSQIDSDPDCAEFVAAKDIDWDNLDKYI